MGYGLIGYDNAGNAGFPSPAVWADCPNTLLIDKALGYYIKADGAGDVNTLPGLPEDSDAGSYTYDDGTVDNRAVIADVGAATDNNALAIHSQPLAKLAKSSGTKLWAETDVAFDALADEAFFFGFGDKSALVRDVVADDPSNSAQAGVIDQSLVGFVTTQASSKIATVDAVYQKAGDGGATTVLADVTNASAIASSDRSNLVAQTFVRLGVYYDGRSKVKFFVNGIKVAEKEVDSTFDQTHDLGVVFALKTGSAAQNKAYYRFIRAAAQLAEQS